MRKSFFSLMVVVLSVCVAAAAGLAETVPSSKAAVLVGDALAPAACDAEGTSWATIFAVQMRNSGVQKDFLIGLSGVTQLVTDTKVKSAGGTQDTSEAEAIIKVRILVDGAAAAPGPIVFDRRKQTLIARFNGICFDENGDGIVQFDECTTPEELQLILETQAAHHFNFVADDVGTGIHVIEGQACTATAGSSQQGSWDAAALFGKGSLAVEEIRLIKDAVIEQLVVE